MAEARSPSPPCIASRPAQSLSLHSSLLPPNQPSLFLGAMQLSSFIVPPVAAAISRASALADRRDGVGGGRLPNYAAGCSRRGWSCVGPPQLQRYLRHRGSKRAHEAKGVGQLMQARCAPPSLSPPIPLHTPFPLPYMLSPVHWPSRCARTQSHPYLFRHPTPPPPPTSIHHSLPLPPTHVRFLPNPAITAIPFPPLRALHAMQPFLAAQLLRQLMHSPPFIQLLNTLTGRVPARCASEVRRFRPGLDYTLAHVGTLRDKEVSLLSHLPRPPSTTCSQASLTSLSHHLPILPTPLCAQPIPSTPPSQPSPTSSRLLILLPYLPCPIPPPPLPPPPHSMPALAPPSSSPSCPLTPTGPRSFALLRRLEPALIGAVGQWRDRRVRVLRERRK